MKYWWLGFNNDLRSNKTRKDGSLSEAMFYEDLREFLGNPGVTTVEWRRHPGRNQWCYGEMQKDDPVLLWMGDGYLHLPWGIMGFARVLRKDAEHVTLLKDWVPPNPWCPTGKHDAEFLFDLFGEGFEPLIKVFASARLMQGTSIVAAYQLEDRSQHEAVRRRVRRLTTQILQQAA